MSLFPVRKSDVFDSLTRSLTNKHSIGTFWKSTRAENSAPFPSRCLYFKISRLLPYILFQASSPTDGGRLKQTCITYLKVMLDARLRKTLCSNLHSLGPKCTPKTTLSYRCHDKIERKSVIHGVLMQKAVVSNRSYRSKRRLPQVEVDESQSLRRAQFSVVILRNLWKGQGKKKGWRH